jgi:branched-chain amino acid aminotransferase
VRQIGELHFTPGPITERLLHEYEALVQMPPDKVSALAA